MTVRENLDMGAYPRDATSTDDMDRVFELFPRLKERASRRRARCPAASSRCSPSAAR